MSLKTIFDSNKALDVADRYKLDYYISGSFKVEKPSQLILTAPIQAFKNLHIDVHRTPQQLKMEDCASILDGIYTKLHDGCIDQPMGVPGSSTYAKSTKGLGKRHDGQMYDWISIDRPGWYYLFALEKENRAMADQNNPIIVELFADECCP